MSRKNDALRDTDLADASQRILVALDVPSLSEAVEIATELKDHVGGFKVGLELLSAEGSGSVVKQLLRVTRRLFYDGKFADIPNTVGAATRTIAGLGVWMLNVHASCGFDSIRACVENRGDSLVVAVTILTSLDEESVSELFGANSKLKVQQFADLAARAGADGIVCSPNELNTLKGHNSTQHLLTVVPGVRPAWARANDQKRVMTPGEAVANGADFVVIGRPILQPPSSVGSRRDAAQKIRSEIQDSLEGSIDD